MSALEILKKVRDVNSFIPKSIHDEDINDILQSVKYTASAANTQPWEVYIIKDENTKKLLSGCVLDPMLRVSDEDTRVANAPLVIVVAINRKRARARYGSLGESYYAVQDVGAAVNNLRLLAAQRGICSSWIREIDLDGVADVLKLTNLIKPMALLIMGYSSENIEEPPLLDSEEWTHNV